MNFWKYVSIGLMIVLIVSILVYIVSWKAGSSLTRNCIVLHAISGSQIVEPVESLYLVTAKLFPVVNTRYATHWSIVAKTTTGYYNISTARYMSIYIYSIAKKDAFHFIDTKWEDLLYILKQYPLNEQQRGVTVYDIALSAMSFYNTDDKLSYSMINHNCQHVAQYILQTFANISKDDPFMVNLKGFALFRKSLGDALIGPKVIL